MRSRDVVIAHSYRAARVYGGQRRLDPRECVFLSSDAPGEYKRIVGMLIDPDRTHWVDGWAGGHYANELHTQVHLRQLRFRANRDRRASRA